MRAGGVDRLVLSSTCAVYGNPVATPIDEDHPTDPINAYGSSKLAVEHALRHYGRAYGLRSIALRYFNAAGADPDRRARRGPRSGDTSDSARPRRGGRGGPAPGVRRRLSDRGRHLPARLRACRGHRRRARPGPRRAGVGAGRAGLQSRHGDPAFRPGGHPQRRTGDGPPGARGAGPAPPRRPAGALRRRRAHRARSRLAAGAPGAGRHRRHRPALARAPPRKATARPHRESTAPAPAVRPAPQAARHRRVAGHGPLRPRLGRSRVHHRADLRRGASPGRERRADLRRPGGALLGQGGRRVLLRLPHGRRRAAPGPRSAHRAVPAHAGPVEDFLRKPDHGAPAVAAHERRGPRPACRLGDMRRPDPRVARARRVRRPAVPPGREARAGVHDGGAARGVPPGPARAARPADERAAARSRSSSFRISPSRPSPATASSRRSRPSGSSGGSSKRPRAGSTGRSCGSRAPSPSCRR